MLLYLVRHGDAENTAPDEIRELTEKGRHITRAMGKLLKRAGFDPPQIIITSPLPRALQTADILAQELAPSARVEINTALLSGKGVEAPMAVIESKNAENNVVMLVGHDPLFSRLASALVSGSDHPAIEMQKSAVAIFELTRFEVPRMRGVLRAYLPPKIV